MFRSAAGAIGTDHHLMHVKIKLHLKSRKKQMKQKRTKYDSARFKDDKRLELFQDDLSGTLSEASNETISIDEKYSLFVEHLKVRAEKHFELDNNTKKRKEWLTDEILQIVAKKKIDARQIEYWDEICEEIESSIKLIDPATAFSIIRRLRGGIDQKLIDEIQIGTLSEEEEKKQNAVPSIEEVRRALFQMKSRKAPGSNEITADLLKAGGEPVIHWLHGIFVDIWKKELMVQDWNLAILIRLYKKGEKQICDNYRRISLLNVTSKIFSCIILNRIQNMIDHQLLEAQSGFRAYRSTMDQIHILNIIMEKRREFNKSLFMCFIDITKAYDSVNRDLLWRVCRKYGISEKLVNLLKMLYKNSKAKVRIEGELSDSFLIETGVQQGGIPSPILFDILFDFIVGKIIEEAGVTGVKFSYGSNDFFHARRERYENFNILALLYADDLVVMCGTASDLTTFIRAFEKVTQEFGLTMSVKKTCTMTLQQFTEDQNRKILKQNEVVFPDIDITIRNQKVETVEPFTYLDCNITRDQKSDSEISTRLAKATTAFNMLRHVV
ncbi:unnamed protein product [Adineta steineri]|uniref:Reverse transcriptase domain-containing protein n=1 Tax=Adineta steineri TaxID=433720 RepID=A0A815EUM5_9BILA|nr:unnamed protein product [Adineta steineri]